MRTKNEESTSSFTPRYRTEDSAMDESVGNYEEELVKGVFTPADFARHNEWANDVTGAPSGPNTNQVVRSDRGDMTNWVFRPPDYSGLNHNPMSTTVSSVPEMHHLQEQSNSRYNGF